MLEFKLLGFAIFCRHISPFLRPKFFPKGLRSGYFDGGMKKFKNYE
jgi:hypothetical protein